MPDPISLTRSAQSFFRGLVQCLAHLDGRLLETQGRVQRSSYRVMREDVQSKTCRSMCPRQFFRQEHSLAPIAAAATRVPSSMTMSQIHHLIGSDPKGPTHNQPICALADITRLTS